MWAYTVHQYYPLCCWPHYSWTHDPTVMGLPPIPINHCELLSIYPNISKVKCQVILGILNSDKLIYLILIWYWIIMDDWNNWMFGVSWRFRIWVKYGWGISVSKKFGYGCGIIWIVDGIISMSWKEDSKTICLARQKGNDSEIVKEEIRIKFNQNIWRYDLLR